MKKISLSILLLFSICFEISGQSIEATSMYLLNHQSNPLNVNKLYTSPEVSQLMKVDFIPTNLYTGKLELDIPLFEIKTDNTSIPISLKYNSGGVKVEEEASNVGLGWVLQAGGNVSCMIRDIDDNQLTVKDKYTFSGFSITPNGKIQLALGYLKRPEDHWAIYNNKFVTTDALPDLFFSSAPGLKSKFVFEREGGNIQIKDIENNGNLITTTGYQNFGQDLGNSVSTVWMGTNKIFPNINPTSVDNFFTSNNYGAVRYLSNDYESFKIINSEGVQYNFGTYDINVSCAQTEFQGGPAPDPWLFPDDWDILIYLYDNYKIKKSTWHLDKITDLKNPSDEVTFEYKKYTNDDSFKHLDFTTLIGSSIHVQGGLDRNSLIENPDIIEEDQERSVHILNAEYNYVSKISWKDGQVEFKYDYHREDAKNKYALSEIIIKNNTGEIIKKYSFNYSYFQSAQNLPNIPSYYGKRLKLDGINLIDRNNGVVSNWYQFTYDNATNLPFRNSGETDFLGYFNNNSVTWNSLMPDHQQLLSAMPKLYFVEDRNQLSITPFPVNSSTEFGGNVSLQANNSLLAGLLKTVKNPTGAVNEFVYEPNQFNFYGQNVTGGGARIKKQLIKENNSIVRQYDYEYLDEQGKSSGYINNIPKFADIFRSQYSNDHTKASFRTYLRAKGNIELTDGAFVGYGRVVQKENGNGYIEKKFTSPKDYPNLYPMSIHLSGISKNSFYPDIYVDQDIKRGKLLENNIFNNNNQLQKREIYNYHEKIFQNEIRPFQRTLISSFIQIENQIHTKYDFTIPIKRGAFLLTSKKTEEYFNGNRKSESLTNYEYYDTNLDKPLNLKKEKTIFSDGSIMESQYQYANDILDCGANHLIQKNVLSIPLTATSIKDNKTISKARRCYQNFGAGQVRLLPSSQESVDISTLNSSNEIYNKDVTYDKYDNKGNLIQYTTKAGNTVGFVWGYNKTLPIAKIEGKDTDYFMTMLSTENELLSTASNSDISPSAEAQFRTKLDLFQDRQNFMNVSITTYTYDPLIGITSMTSPSKIRTFYKYDSAGRLEKVIDDQEKVSKEYKYNYKN